MLKVAILGRPNVGKSTLFNRVVGKNKAITSSIAGTTRDSVTSIIEWNGKTFELTDMGGLDYSVEDDLVIAVSELIKSQLSGFDLILFTTDAQTGVVQTDMDNLQLVRKYEKPVWLVVNKCDNAKIEQESVDFYSLGIEQAFFISSTQGKNVAQLLDDITALIPDEQVQNLEDVDTINVAILGRPNVGKSSIVNALLGKNKVLVSDVAGTTRDAVDTELRVGEDTYVLIDTAGIRRPGKIKPRSLEQYSIMRGEYALDRAHIAVLVLDATEGITHQDQHIISKILEKKKGLIVVANKWDIVDKEAVTKDSFLKYAIQELDYLRWATFIFTSAVTGKGIQEILTQAKRIRTEQQTVIPAEDLAFWFLKVTHKHPMFGFFRSKPIKIYSVSQFATDPPRFEFLVNEPKGIHFSTKRYFENQLREHFDFNGVAIKCSYKKRR